MKAGVKKSLRPKARPGKEKMKDMVEAAEQRKRDGEALKRSVKYRAEGGKMEKVEKMASGGNVCRGMGAAKRGGNFVVG